MWEQSKSKGSEVCLAHFHTGCIRGAEGFVTGFHSFGKRAPIRKDAVAGLCCPDPSCGHPPWGTVREAQQVAVDSWNSSSVSAITVLCINSLGFLRQPLDMADYGELLRAGPCYVLSSGRLLPRMPALICLGTGHKRCNIYKTGAPIIYSLFHFA